jgi:7-cyano-7-deazaguanine synthase
MDSKKEVVLILSGGLDSSTLLYKLLDEGNAVTALSFNYGQKASIEIEGQLKSAR